MSTQLLRITLFKLWAINEYIESSKLIARLYMYEQLMNNGNEYCGCLIKIECYIVVLY